MTHNGSCTAAKGQRTMALARLLKGSGQWLLLLKGGAVVWCCNNKHRFSAYLLLLKNNNGDAT